MERKIRIGAVSYLNTKPLLYGLQHGPKKDVIGLTLDYPSNLVRALKNDQIDIGLLPVGALPGLGDFHILSDYCIATEGEVASVAVFSEVPMEEIENVYLDYQSRTSVLLCQLLFEKHWKKKVNFIVATDETYIEQIKDKTAGLIIGDRALLNRSAFGHIYDLGMGWKEMTGLPFVFAVWVCTKDEAFLADQLAFCGVGLSSLEAVIAENPFPHYDLQKYYQDNIAYRLSPAMKESIQLYLSLVS